MHWENGFKRLRLVGTGSLALGAILLLIVILTDSLGYAPNPGFAMSLFTLCARLGPLLLVLGALLWLAVWVLMGFVPEHAVPEHAVPEHAAPEHTVPEQAPPRERFYR